MAVASSLVVFAEILNPLLVEKKKRSRRPCGSCGNRAAISKDRWARLPRLFAAGSSTDPAASIGLVQWAHGQVCSFWLRDSRAWTSRIEGPLMAIL